MPSARDTASTLLAGLDEDVLDYLVTMLEGDEEQEAMEATVAEFTVDRARRHRRGGDCQVPGAFCGAVMRGSRRRGGDGRGART